MREKTLCIIKPDAVRDNHCGAILSMIESTGLHLCALRMLTLSAEQAADFYAEHRSRPFFPELISYMSSGPIVVAVLEGEDAVSRYRKLMGSTDPIMAEPDTLRKKYGKSKEENAVHGSDSLKSAERELSFFSSFICE